MKRMLYKFLLRVNEVEQRILHKLHSFIRKGIEWCDAHS